MSAKSNRLKARLRIEAERARCDKKRRIGNSIAKLKNLRDIDLEKIRRDFDRKIAVLEEARKIERELGPKHGTGPEAETLKLNGNWEDAVAKSFTTKGGWGKSTIFPTVF